MDRAAEQQRVKIIDCILYSEWLLKKFVGVEDISDEESRYLTWVCGRLESAHAKYDALIPTY